MVTCNSILPLPAGTTDTGPDTVRPNVQGLGGTSDCPGDWDQKDAATHGPTELGSD